MVPQVEQQVSPAAKVFWVSGVSLPADDACSASFSVLFRQLKTDRQDALDGFLPTGCVPLAESLERLGRRLGGRAIHQD